MKRPMVQLQIAGLRRDLDDVLDVLQQLACVELIGGEAELTPLLTEAPQVQEEEALSLLQARIEGLLELLTWEAAVEDRPVRSDLESIRSEVERVGGDIRELTRRRDALEAEQASLPRYKTTLRKLVPLMPPEAGQPNFLSSVVLVSDAHSWVLRTLREQVDELAGGRQRIVEENIGDGLRAMFIVVPRDVAAAVQSLLGQQDIAQMQLPDTLAGRPPDEAAAALDQRLAAIPAEIESVAQRLHDMGRQWAPRLARWHRYVADRLERVRARDRVSVTDRAFVFYGWTPVDDEARVRSALDTFDAVHVVTVAPHPQEEDVPVALDNPGPARPFETLVRLMVYPRYDGIDPTILMAIFLPIFFGMILGDVGYAAVIFLLCLAGLRRYREPGTVRDIIQVLLLGSLWGAVFGILYGEAFGTLGEAWGLHALWLERAAPEYVTTLLLFTIGVGVVHVSLGLVLGIWTSWQERSRSHLLERGGMLVGLIGLLALVGALTDYIPAVLTAPSVALLIVGLVLLSSSQGWLGILLGPIEFIGLLGNILSYLRIAAVGLASVYVALVANEMAGNLGSLVVGIIVAVLIHALNIVLGAFSPTIHSLRLHYVEFFRKFYEGGGRPFQPFGGRG